MGTLYLVGTPIGNLGDISLRALDTLRTVDFVAAEDTRVSLKLLNHYDIKKPLVSYHAHNARQKGGQILPRLLAGENCALVTDAGMPCISDPGEELVALCAENGVDIVVVPGPSAAVSALAVSGLPTSRFAFEGFLSTNRTSRYEHLQQIRRDAHTLIFYEAPHKLPATLRDLLEVLGDRRVALCRELTKMYEEVVRTTLSQAAAHYSANTPKGEFVLIVEGAAPAAESPVSLEEAVEMVLSLQRSGAVISAAAKDVAHQTGHKKGDLYKAALTRMEEGRN